FDLIDNVYDQYTKRVSTSLLNTKLAEFTERLSPPRYRNRPNKINYATQISVKPPTFVFFVREAKAVYFSYERYLANRIHEELGFENTPVRLIFRKKGSER
ncbi:MAG: ribosome biogenesis GTPase Der, partial [Thermodesulfobacteriota bacterium]|nr:ribosome biogenesis GTPase Der [Thermodesulfobacteriota bacterium]